MVTLMDLGNEVMKIREALNELEVKGKRNASILVFADETCNKIVNMINDAAKQAQNGSEEGTVQEFNSEPKDVG